MRFSSVIAASLLLVAAACEGPEGPAGPQGPPGPQGPNGVANRVMMTDIADAYGDASVQLPAIVGSNPASPPALSCYHTDSPSSGVWLMMADSWSSTSAYCGLVFSSGRWNAVAIDMVPGWTVAFVVTY